MIDEVGCFDHNVIYIYFGHFIETSEREIFESVEVVRMVAVSIVITMSFISRREKSCDESSYIDSS